VSVLVVEPDPTLGEVAELDPLALGHGHGDATGAVAAAEELVHAGLPVVEGADRGDRAIVDVVGHDELDLGVGAVGGDAQGHGGSSRD
jgi:hypothetical protein